MAIVFGGAGSSITVEDLLTSTDAANALSANQGRVLNEKIDALGTVEHSAADITARDALTDLIIGDRVFVADASSEADVDNGWAIYRPTSVDASGSGLTWQKVAEEEAIADPTIVVPFSTAYSLTGVSNVITEVPATGLISDPDETPSGGVVNWLFNNTATGQRTVALPTGYAHTDQYGNTITSFAVSEDATAIYTVQLGPTTWIWSIDNSSLLLSNSSNTVQGVLSQSYDGLSIANIIENNPSASAIIRVTDDSSTVTPILALFNAVTTVGVNGYNGVSEILTTTGTDTIPRGTYLASISGGTQLLLRRLSHEVQSNVAVVESANLDTIFGVDVVSGLTALEFLSQYDSNRLLFRNTNSNTTLADMVAANASLTSVNLVDESNTTTSLTTPTDDATAIEAGSYLISLNGAGDTLTLQTLSTPSDKTDLTQTLELFSVANGLGHGITQEYVNGVPYTRVAGTDNTDAALFQTEVSFDSDREIVLRVRKDATATVASSLRIEDSNGDYAEFVFNVTDGTNGLDDTNANGVFPVPELAKSIETNDHYEWAVRFPAPTGGVAPYTVSLIPDFGVVSTTTGIGSPAVVGSIDVASLELDAFVAVSDVTATKVNSSAASTNESLPAASGSGEVRFWVNEDVTNSATLSVAVGDSLNGVADGTFTFSVYPAGTQFVATDTSAGEWVIAVQGEGIDSSTPVFIEGAIIEYDTSNADEDFEAFNLNNLIAETAVAGWDVDPANNILNGGFSISADGGLVVPTSGWYDVRLRLTHPTVRPTAATTGNQDDVGFFRARIYNATTFGDADGATGGFWDGEFEAPDSDTIESSSLSTRMYINELTNIYIGMRAAVDSAGIESICVKEFSVRPVSDQAVLAGMVTPEDARDTIFSADGISVNTAGTTLTLDNGLTWADVAANYETLVVANAVSGGAQHVHSIIDVALLDLDNGQTYLPAINAIGGGGNFAAAITSIDSADGDFTYQHFFTTTVDFRIYGYKKQKTVVMPEALVPESLSRIQVSLTTTTNSSGATHYAFDETNFSQGSDLSLSGTGSIQGLQAGKTYKLTWQGSTDSTSNGTTVFRFVDLSTDATIGESGWEIISSGQNVPESSQGSSSAFFTPIVNTEVGVDFIGGTVGEMSGNSIFTVEQLPNSTVLVESDIPLEDLEEVVFSGSALANSSTFDFGSYADVTAMITAGFSRLRYSVRVEHNNALIDHDAFNGEVDLADIVANDRLTYQSDGAGNFIALDMNAGDTTGGIISFGGGSYTSNIGVKLYAVKPQKTVVMSNVLEVEDNEVLLDSGTGDGGADFGQPINTLSNDYKYIKFVASEIIATGNSGFVSGVREIDTEFFAQASAAGTVLVNVSSDGVDSSSGYLSFATGDITGNTMAVADVGALFNTNQYTWKIIGVKAQKTVINTTDTPVDTNEIGTALSATSTKVYTMQWNGTSLVNVLSYEYEITANGNFECNHLTGSLKQWGLFNGAGADNDQTVTLPTPFANTNYSVVANSATAGQEWAVGTRATATSSFTLNRNDSGSGPTDYHWQAIGVKP